VGNIVSLKFLEVDQAKNRLVVSNRRAMVEAKLTNLEPGQLVEVCDSYYIFLWQSSSALSFGSSQGSQRCER